VLQFNAAAAEEKPLPPPPPAPAIWQYGYGELSLENGKLNRFSHFPTFHQESWQGGTNWPDSKLGWLRLKNSAGHPGEGLTNVVVRRWTSPTNGLVKIKSKISHAAAEGDGIRATVLHSSAGNLASFTLHQQTNEFTLDAVRVKAGDTIDFVVDSRATLAYDDFEWSPALSLVVAKPSDPPGEPKLEWNAQKDFAGPPPAPPKPLNSWSALAQAIFLSNEFSFVD
jgi:plastocyanin